jgi:hypothetical protein
MMRSTVFVLVLLISTPCLAAEPTFTGSWLTSFGPMQLKQQGDRVTGSYSMGGVACPLQGKVSKGRYEFTYREGTTTGEGWFQLAKDGKTFLGKWRAKGSTPWLEWNGIRSARETGFAGLWTSTFGRLRLLRKGDAIEGIYTGLGESTITGKVKDGRFEFRYQEPTAKGEGWFELAEGGTVLKGKWRPDGGEQWGDWNATRIVAKPGIIYLVVLEARWETSLAEQEYAFGDMLKTYFERTPNVQVRRRALNEAGDLGRWCRELALLAEPVVLSLSSHGTAEGLQVGGQTVKPEVIAESLRYADNIHLVHFSSCLMMKNQLAERVAKQLGSRATFPISGYTTAVDWGASAVIEFMYFDLILARRMPPAKAAQQIKILFPTAGNKRVPGAVFAPAGFRILLPTPPVTEPAKPAKEKAAASEAKPASKP